MGLIDNLQEKYKFKVDDLSKEERSDFYAMLSDVQKTELDPQKMRDHMAIMRYTVEKLLIKEPEFVRVFIFKFANRKQILLKARLQNYMMLEAFLSSHKKAQQFLEDSLAVMHNKFYM